MEFKKEKAPLLEIAELEGSYVVYVDLRGYFSSMKHLKQLLSHNNIEPLYLSSNYFPPNPNSLDIRFCIAVECVQFDKFLVAFEQVIGESKIDNMKDHPMPKL
jgi:hypothetical protein